MPRPKSTHPYGFSRTRAVRAASPLVRRFSSALLGKLAKRTKFVDPALAENFATLVGPELAAIARPGRITGAGGKNGRTLEIITPTGAAATKVSMRVDDIMTSVNKFLGPGTIGHIAVKQAGGRETQDISQAKQPITANPDGADPLAAVLARYQRSLKDGPGEE